MRYLIVSGSPNPDNLCLAVIQEVTRGAQDGGADVQVLQLEGIEPCRGCNDGWGECKNEHLCAFGKDGFQEAQGLVRQADALCVITPVYWSESSDSLTNFLERLRRCEFGQISALANKPVLFVAFPGGADNSLLACLEHMDKFCRNTGAVIFDYLGVNLWNSDYIKLSAYSAGRVMAYGRRAKESSTRTSL